ncbi:hypothetical protein [Aliirhizobium cellulosilyticum]|uniref:Uncharacterized protein n=1 Tax=Aliirhizobium cellulosilyticum TaxID=393664 RepID=A0A7W6Y6U3_9HYPH|nr:hypothetical protein [Rhizobium cellulosilyticum]MBB4351734.1 hypothetical protein [Rhizobium cellulosilyticum]MBB4415010.1 hypothetical protein [Rhizobium cellulosilyticum]MBB4449660.1 hypothetical protein [Rhizobium cellulosilyticum]
MRTPWRFVADLVSRNPKMDTREQHPATAREPIALEHQPEKTDVHLEIEAQPAEQTIEVAADERLDAARRNNSASLEHVRISDEASASAVDGVSAISADAKGSAAIDARAEITEIVAAREETPTVDALAEPVDMPQLKRQKTTRAFVQQPTPSSQTEDNASAVPKSLMHEMADLDAEIDALRRQLERKLSEQNAQLRKMLARFDAK